MADALLIVDAPLFGEFFPRDRADSKLLAHILDVLDWREIVVPGELEVEFHVQLCRHLARLWNLMLIVTKHNELPRQAGKIPNCISFCIR